MAEIDFKKLRGWPYIWIGVAATLFYFATLAVFFSDSIQQIIAPTLPISDLGNALSGLFSPLALVWLIVGILQQGKELQVQVRELKESVEAQKAMAKSSGGQERLQTEQFLERMYRLYKAGAEDLLFLLLDPQNLMVRRAHRGEDTSIALVSREFIEQHRGQFKLGRRSELYAIVREVNKHLADTQTLKEHANYILAARKHQVFALAKDFIEFDDLRKRTLSEFEGGKVLGAVDDHEGFSDARKLVEGYLRLTTP